MRGCQLHLGDGFCNASAVFNWPCEAYLVAAGPDDSVEVVTAEVNRSRVGGFGLASTSRISWPPTTPVCPEAVSGRVVCSAAARERMRQRARG